jgi:dTDP-4-amino-4,6-dideoxygalactose transaminase
MSYVTRMLPQDLMVALEERGIQTRPGFYPLSWFPHMFKASTWSNPVAERLLRELLILPSGPDLTEDQMIYTMEMIGEVTDCWA